MPGSPSSGLRDLIQRVEAEGDAERAARGLASRANSARIAPAAVFILPPRVAQFPEARLASAGRATHHERRVIVVQGGDGCLDDELPSVLVVPCTASYRGPVRSCDFAIPEGESAFSKPGVVAYVSLVQPVLKSELGEFKGRLRIETLGRLMGVLARNFGITGPAPDRTAAGRGSS